MAVETKTTTNKHLSQLYIYNAHQMPPGKTDLNDVDININTCPVGAVAKLSGNWLVGSEIGDLKAPWIGVRPLNQLLSHYQLTNY